MFQSGGQRVDTEEGAETEELQNGNLHVEVGADTQQVAEFTARPHRAVALQRQPATHSSH